MGGRDQRRFQGQPGLHVAPSTTEHADNVYWVFGVTVDAGGPFTRDQLMAGLQSQGIATRTFFYGLHQQPALLNTRLVDATPLSTTETLADTGFYLPSGLGLTEPDQNRVADAVVRFIEQHS